MKYSKFLKRGAGIFVLGLFLIALPISVFAGTEKFKESIFISEDEIVEGNFIRAGNIIEINGVVNGDVIVAGNNITITGSVAGDVIAAGNLVKITGPVEGSVRVVGSNVEIDSPVKRNAWAIGANVSFGENAAVEWDLFSAGATVSIDGPVGGNVWMAGASLILNSEVGKDVEAKLDTDGQLLVGSSTVIAGDLTYEAKEEAQLTVREGAAVTGETIHNAVSFDPNIDFEEIFSAAYIFFKIVSFFSLLFVGLIFVSLVPKIMVRVHDEMSSHPMPSLGWGLVFLVFTPIVSILLFITIIGIPLGMMLIPIYIIMLYLSKTFAGFTVGLMILNSVAGEKKYSGSLVWPLVIGLLIIVAVTSIPILGWLVSFLLTLWAIGGLLTIKRELWKEYR